MNADKFAALAMLPADGKDAGRELQRCVTKMRFVGGVLGLGRGSGAALGPAYEELWCVAEKYRVPVVLRDVWPVGSEVRLPSWSERWKRSGCADRD
jgi:predicted TIM-barrel fold metal-dependent hydrolase